jgi:hypothetical protein
MKAGPSNPQQGYVGTDRAKVQRKNPPMAGTIRGLAIWIASPESKNVGWQTPPRSGPPVGVPTQVSSCAGAVSLPCACAMAGAVLIRTPVLTN